MIRVLTSPHSSSSVKLGYATYSNMAALRPDWRENDVLLRWGNSEPKIGNMAYGPELNTQESIALNCNKARAHEKLGRAVTVPPLFRGSVPRDMKAVVRPLEHSAGSGFQVVTGPYTIGPDQYAMKYIETDKEYRVWYAFGTMIAAKRVPMRDTNQGEEEYPCRSKWGYAYKDLASLPVLKEQASRAFNRMDLDLGAADVLWDEGERKWYFLEINTAPSLDHEPVLNLFSTAIERKFEECLSPQLQQS